jgi:single-stranded-DNA-specific exonuclease
MLWHATQSVAATEDLREAVGGHPLVAERLASAGVLDPEQARGFLDPIHYRPGAPDDLPDLSTAVDRLRQAVAAGERILLQGDDDVDGQAATALIKIALERLGANFQIQLPIREGVERAAFEAASSEAIRVLITLNRRISPYQQPTTDNRQPTTDVIIIDHRSTGHASTAFADIDPGKLPEGHPMRSLPRTALAYKLAIELDHRYDGEDYLDLVALGVVGDFAELQNDARHLLQRGLAALRITRRLGLQAMFSAAGVDPLGLDETDVSLSLAPRLAAQGRLGDAAEGVELLTTADAARAAELANQLEGMNARRKLETRLVIASVRSTLEREPSLLDYAAIVLAHADWSLDSLGGAAYRLAREYQKPVVLLRDREGMTVGRAHSAAGLNIAEALAACESTLERYGGNGTAAFLRLRSENLFDFRRALSRTIREMTPKAEDPGSLPGLLIDADVKLREITMDFVRDLRRLSPFGPGNPAPALAARSLRAVRKKKLGREGDHLELLVEDETGARQRLFWWNAGERRPPAGRFDLAFTPVIRRFQGQSEIALELLDLHPLEPDPGDATSDAPAYEVEDFSRAADPEVRLTEALERYPQALVWREGDASVAGKTRSELGATETLIVWTPPPGPEEWQAALEQTRPQRIIVFAQSPSTPTVEAFLQRLGGLLKYAIHARGGETTPAALGGATAQRVSTVRYGLQWFEARGLIQILRATRSALRLIQATPLESPPDQRSLEKLIKASLAETAAYRKHWTV